MTTTINHSTVHRSPLIEAALSFHLLTCQPCQLGLHGASFDPALGVPTRFLSLPRMERLLRQLLCARVR